ncbi:ABC transporter permease [Pseudopedobacter beijingensis]|uniref:ABC transporter permease n=1 Tax=Pseudopedobacter beijingensis TaxID=1207056 RepID=A0ABW4IFQ6_9SPHI
MNLGLFIARRISFNSERTFSKLIVRIAIAGIMLGLSVMLLSIAVMKGFKNEIRDKVRGFNGDIQVQKYDLNSSYENSPITITTDTLQNLKKVQNIRNMVPYATKPGIIKTDNEVEGVVFKGIGADYDWKYFNKIIVEGKGIDFKAENANQQIIISDNMAKRLQLKVGDSFLMYFVQESLRKRKFEIVGIYNTGVEEIDKTFVVGDINLVRRLNKWEDGQVGGYEVRVNNFDELEWTAMDMGDLLPMTIKAMPITDIYTTIFDWLSLLDVNAQVVLILMLIVAVINMISALLIMILERTTMIGLLKALGSSNWEIRKIFLYNAAYLVVIGLILGNILGLGIGYFQFYTHFFKLDEASYYMSFIPIYFQWQDILLINVGTVAICLLVLLIPSMLVSNISPIKSLSFK